MKALITISMIFIAGFALAQDKKNVLLVDSWFDSTIAAAPENARFNDLWAFDYLGDYYVVLGSTFGSHFFQVHQDSLEFLDSVEGRFNNFIVRHRDFKSFQNYIYAVCDEGSSSLQIIDISYLPDSVSLVYDDTTFFENAHNLYIDTAKAKMYVCSPDDLGMKVLDLSDPTNPVLLTDFMAVPDVHDCFVRDDTAFLNCGFDGLRIYDFEGGVPLELGVLDFYPNQGYNHSGWMNNSKKNYAFIDETTGTKVKICDLNDLSQISISESFGTEDYLEMVPHNIVLLESIAIVAYYKEGLRIFDISTLPIREIASYDTYEIDSDFKLNGAWGVGVFPERNQILISDRQNGLFLFSFPILVIEEGVGGSFATSTPFIDANGILITPKYFRDDNLYFTIVDISGKIVYEQENYLNWFHIPLELSAGTYIYGIFDKDREILEGGKFVKSN
ncbi:choice-of-anchor B family protein [Crocinitomix catalasitica]|nr:choice-of-anchor B family protein [Crocinitomix catalasitica]